MAKSAQVVALGRTEYAETLALQRRLHARRAGGEIGDILLLTEHERVITLGRNADERNIRAAPETLAARGINVVRIERGGDVTYHGPGQLIAYPIVDLRDLDTGVRDYVRQLEQSAIALLAKYDVDGQRRDGAPGVWVGQRKIASVGVYVSRWVTMHGIAINIAADLTGFDLIHPCGLVGVRMTSVAELKGRAPAMPDAVFDYAEAFADVFALRLSPARRFCNPPYGDNRRSLCADSQRCGRPRLRMSSHSSAPSR